jgi:(S)-2-hydroxyglutarate dehydrogenase
VTLTPAAPPTECDLVVVGAGIVGLAVARELLSRQPGTRLVVLEKEDEIAMHQTGHSSGVVHAGIYYEPGSLKAKLCVEGARELFEYCDDRGLPVSRSGKLIVATEETELPRLDELELRGNANGVKGLQRISPAEIAEREPHVRGIAALHSPNTGVVDFVAVARALAEDVRSAGGEVFTACPVRRVKEENGAVRIQHRRGKIHASAAVACAGLWADRLDMASGGSAEPRIVPFRGAYLRLRPERRDLVRGLVYPVPDPEFPFLGMHLTREIGGDVLLGPSALPVGARDAYSLHRVRPRDIAETLSWPGTWRMAGGWWKTGLGEIRAATNRGAFVAQAARFVPELSVADVLPGPAGIRAQAVARDGTLVDDFIVSRTGRTLHVRNAPSPAATSSLALARLIANRLQTELGVG